ncbi:DUF4129 domain-containing protein [Flexivirga sp. B27]
MRRDGGPPLDPSGGTAHDWLQRELSKPAYADQRSWLQRLWDWATDRLGDLLQGVGGALPLYVLIPLLLAIVAAVVFGLSRLQPRGAGRTEKSDEGVLTDVDLSAEQLRSRAERLASEGALSAAFIDHFRALTRRAEERALLLPQPGRTAHEVGTELAPHFPAQSDGIHSAAVFFDAVRYGGAEADVDDVARVSALDREIDRTRPHHPDSDRVSA